MYGKSEIEGSTTYALMPKDGFLHHVSGRFVAGRLLVRVADTRYPRQFTSQAAKFPCTELSSDFNGYHILNWLVYLASNDLVHAQRNLDWSTLLDLLANRVSRRTVMTVFSSNSLSIRATWEHAMKHASHLDHEEAVIFLIEMILDMHVDWIEPIMNNKVLFTAARCKDIGLLRKLLAVGARPCVVLGNSDGSFETAIISAIKAEAWDCVHLLLQHSDINTDLEAYEYFCRTPPPRTQPQVIFQFIMRAIYGCWRRNPDNGRMFLSQVARKAALEICFRALRLCLQAGFNFDTCYFQSFQCGPSGNGPGLVQFHLRSSTTEEWLPTCLDMSLYWDERLFKFLAPHSIAYNSPNATTRAGICKALMDGGNEALDQYFKSHPRPAQDVLEMLLAEQFFIDIEKDLGTRDRINGRLARLLIAYGVAINSRVVQQCGGVSLLLRRVIACARTFGHDEDMRFILVHLRRNGAVTCERTVQAAVETSGVYMLEVLTEYEVEIGRYGKCALVEALYLRNLDAAGWLLNKGVSIISEYTSQDSRSRDLTLCGAWWEWRGLDRQRLDPLESRNCDSLGSHHLPDDLEIPRYVCSRGAHPKVNTSDPNSYQFFLKLSLDPLRRVKFPAILRDFPEEIDRLSDPERGQLFASFGHEIIRDQQLLDNLRSRYEDFDNGCILAAAISGRASRTTITQLLAATTNLEIYSGEIAMTPLQAAASVCNQHVIQVLLSQGANLNAPAGYPCGKTALQAICEFEPLTVECAQARQSIIRLFLEKDVNCNVPACFHDTLLNRVVLAGDLEIVALLLEYGVDPNYVSWDIFDVEPYEQRQLTGLSALDTSAVLGRLDLTHLLLKAGGLSAHPGSTGYEGAIRLASRGAILEVIQRHMKQRDEEFSQLGELRQTHQAMINRVLHCRLQAAQEFGVDP